MRVYWDTDWSAWVVAWSDGYETILSADSEAEAVLQAQLMQEDEGVLHDE